MITPEQQKIIDRYFEGWTVKDLIKDYQECHTVKSDKTKKEIKMPKTMAAEVIYNALKK